MKNLIYGFLAISAFVGMASTGSAQNYASYGDEVTIFRPGPKPTKLVKYYKPTQTYYGKGYVIRYGYTTTTPSAAGYTVTPVSQNAILDQYLATPRSEFRRDVTVYNKASLAPQNPQPKAAAATAAPAPAVTSVTAPVTAAPSPAPAAPAASAPAAAPKPQP